MVLDQLFEQVAAPFVGVLELGELLRHVGEEGKIVWPNRTQLEQGFPSLENLRPQRRHQQSKLSHAPVTPDASDPYQLDTQHNHHHLKPKLFSYLPYINIVFIIVNKSFFSILFL